MTSTNTVDRYVYTTPSFAKGYEHLREGTPGLARELIWDIRQELVGNPSAEALENLFLGLCCYSEENYQRATYRFERANNAWSPRPQGSCQDKLVIDTSIMWLLSVSYLPWKVQVSYGSHIHDHCNQLDSLIRYASHDARRAAKHLIAGYALRDEASRRELVQQVEALLGMD